MFCFKFRGNVDIWYASSGFILWHIPVAQSQDKVDKWCLHSNILQRGRIHQHLKCRTRAVESQVCEWRLGLDDGFLVATWSLGWQSDGLHQADDDAAHFAKTERCGGIPTLGILLPLLHPLARNTRWQNRIADLRPILIDHISNRSFFQNK